MAILHIDGFDSYSLSTDFGAEYIAIGSTTLNPTAGRYGGQCAQLSNGVGYLGTILPLATYTDMWQGVAHRRDRVDNFDYPLMYFVSPLGIETCLSHNNNTGILKVWRGDKTTLLATASVAIIAPQSVYHWYEFRTVWHGSAGIIEVWVDGVNFISISAQNTQQNPTATGLSSARIGSTADAVWQYFDDWYVLDNLVAPNTGRLGDSRITTLAPTSDATPNQGVQSTGATHWGVVDEPGMNTTDYTDLTNTSGQAEMFGFTSSIIAPIFAVKTHASGWKTDAADVFVSAQMKSGATTIVGNSVPLLTAVNGVGVNRSKVLSNVDPNTSAAWTAAGLSALVAGVKIT